MLHPKRAVSALLGVIILISIVSFSSNPVNSRLNPSYWIPMSLSPPRQEQKPLTTHIVLFQFKPSASHTAIKEVTAKFLGLKKACRHPATKAPYIVSVTGGRDNSKENLQNGFTHAFIMQFYSDEDRDYYVDHDPVHQEFKDSLKGVLEKAQVIDFQNGVFT
ncbi:dabb-domain-containing protein [Westerdykella ornata]|uniref:Dabb-domain-containing protein n=1 Tax=Westerdykella ornata TaxID=318751 RepID=A0A6A6JAN5_WESOR|nr:dabb-domain-containing protein [Westerdykella ornata]KAF2273233.1 dabb-domain-containing protein [Westerdykella ornata]